MAILTRGERFKDARTVHNQHGKQTMKIVEQATGVSASLIKDLEDNNSTRSVGYDKVAALAKHYGVSSDWLLSLTDDPAIKPSAVDELGLNPVAVKEIKELAEMMGYFDGEHPRGTSLHVLNVFLINSLRTPIYEMINRLHGDIQMENNAEPTNLIDDDSRLRYRGIAGEDIASGYILEKELFELHPELKGRIHVRFGTQRVKPQVDEICNLFREIIEEMTGYRKFSIDMELE